VNLATLEQSLTQAEFFALLNRHDAELPKILRSYARTHIAEGRVMVATNLLRAAKLLEGATQTTS